MMRTIEPPPPALVDERGHVRFGTFSGPIADVNLIDAQPYALPLPRSLRAARLKEWQAFQLGSPRWFVALALFDAKLVALAQCKVFDRETHRKFVFERKLPPWALHAPRNVIDSTMAHSGLRFRSEFGRQRVTIAVDLPAGPQLPGLRGELILDASGCESQVVSTPFAANRGMYSHKCCMRPQGQLQLGDETLAFSRADSFAFLDDHKGYYAYVMRWDWVTGGGLDAQGRMIGFNLTRNASIEPERYNECCVWIDGKLHLLPPVRFTRRPGADPSGAEVWEVRDAQGCVSVDFVIEVDGYVKVNALVVESRYRGPFGHVRGSVVVAGERVALDGLFGMGEDFHLRC